MKPREGQLRAAAGRTRPGVILALACAAQFMLILDLVVVNVALPTMQRDLRLSSSDLQWVVISYGLTFGGFLLLGGRAADLLGRRNVLVAGLTMLTAGSLAASLAGSLAPLLAARAAQGFGAAMAAPAALSVLTGTFAEGPARNKALGIFGGVAGSAACLGLVVSGLLVGGPGWRWIFLINVPVGIAALSLIRRLVPESRAEHARRLDPAGMTLALAALVLPLVEGPQVGWPAWTWLCLGLAVPLVAVFLLHQSWLGRRGGDPLIELDLFRRRSLAVGLATQLGLWCSMASFFLVLALYLQLGRGLDALQAGSVFTILAAAFVATSLRAPALTLRYGRWLIATGALTLAAGFGALLAAVSEIGAAGSLWTLVPGLLLVGAGQGLTITPLTATVLSHAEPERAGTVSGVLSTMQQMGNALGVAITGVIFFSALRNGFAHAFATSLVELGCLLLGVAALTWLLPGNRAAPK